MMEDKIKKVAVFWLLLLLSSFFLWHCERDETLSFQEKPVTSMKRISFSSLPSKLMKNINQLEGVLQRDTGEDAVLIIDESQVIEMIDSLNNTRYSIKLYFQEQPENVLYNLILGTDNDHFEIEPFVLKYTIDNISEIWEEDHLDFSKMSGTIEDYSFDQFLDYVQRYLEESREDVVDSCNEYTGDGGEFENTDDETPNDSTDNCNINVWSHGETGEVFAITWSCDSGNSGSVGLRTADCHGGTESSGGAAGINNGNASEQDCDPPNVFVSGVCICPDDSYINEQEECTKRPCQNDPVHSPLVAAQTYSGIQGGMYGKTRNGGTKWHRGLDLVNPYGAPVFAMYNGAAVKKTQFEDGVVAKAGHYVKVTSMINGKTVQILYFHMQSGNRASGTVKAGDIIGYQGASGNLRSGILKGYATSHLHIKVKENGKAVNPLSYLNTVINSSGQVSNPCN